MTDESKRAPWVLTVPGRLSPEAIARVRAMWANAWSGQAPALLVLPEGATLAPLPAEGMPAAKSVQRFADKARCLFWATPGRDEAWFAVGQWVADLVSGIAAERDAARAEADRLRGDGVLADVERERDLLRAEVAGLRARLAGIGRMAQVAAP